MYRPELLLGLLILSKVFYIFLHFLVVVGVGASNTDHFLNPRIETYGIQFSLITLNKINFL